MVLDPGASSITVAVRVRPFTIREAAQLVKNDDGTLFLGDGSLAGVPTPKLHQRGIRSVIKVMDERSLVFDPPEDNPVQKFSRSVVPAAGKKVKDQVFGFDRVFDDNTSQTDVYEGTTKNLLDSVLDGYNATVFAYGATGCGKTHTITGTAQHPGIIFLTMQELFEKIAERSEDKVTEISLSYLEIYNETIRDLLVPGGSKQGLMLREDANQAVSVPGLTSHHPRDVQEVMDIIVQGNEYRTVSPTEANAVSSRSHAVLQINVAQKDRNADVSEPHTVATLSIIDLAGSERASATKNRGERLIEGANINKSLLALGSCINALCDPRKRNHVPYRNSKLTRLLKFSLGGNCKTVMIVCVSPSSAHFDETQNTLRYANRAKNIQTKVTRNVFNVNRHVKDFLVKIDEQMALIKQLREEKQAWESQSFEKYNKQLEKRELCVREGVQRLRTAYEHASAERQAKIADMKRLKVFERRIGLLSAWIASFDTVCDSREDENAMPPNLSAMRKSAQGILAELEHSRQHIHQKLQKSDWERAIDIALQHSISNLHADMEVTDSSAITSLSREADLLKANFMNQACREVLEQERSGDAATVQLLLTAQFEMITSFSETLAMSEEDAVARAKGIVNRLLETGYSAASQVIRPDGSLMPAEGFPPARRGTPKRKKAAAAARVSVQPVPAPVLAAVSPAKQQVFASPMKASPRRRKVATGRKGVTFTPVKKRSPSKRAVRWRDDETEEGTLADFEKTPQKANNVTPDLPSPPEETMPAVPAVPAYLNNVDSGEDSSPSSLLAPEAASLTATKPNRFKAGFLSKPMRSSTSNGSPVPPSLSLDLSGSSDADERPSPLRSVDVHRVANIPSPRTATFAGASPTRAVGISTVDENTVPPMTVSAGNTSGSDNDDTIDTQKLRLALNSAKRQSRLSSMGSVSSSSNAKRVSSIGSNPARLSHRPSASYSGPLASSTNGISRQRRGSNERRRSPPITCSPLASEGSTGGSGGKEGGANRVFTPSQARRMNLGGSMRIDSGNATSPADGAARRITIGSAGMAAAISGSATRGRDMRGSSSVAWR